MKRFALKLLALSLLACSAGAASAAATGAAGISKVSFTLIDLTPDDGVAPSITFNPDPAGAYSPFVYGELRASTFNEDAYREFQRLGMDPLSAVSASGSTGMSWATGSANGAAGLGFSNMMAQGEAMSGTGSSGSFYTIVQAPLALFTLSANTAVRFSVDGWASGQTTIGKDASGVFDEWGGGVLRLETGGLDASGELVMDRAEEYAAGTYLVDELGHVSGTSDSWSGTLSVMYSNATGHKADGSFAAELTASGHSVSAVPEPAESAMLLAGLGLIGAVARRRPRKPSGSGSAPGSPSRQRRGSRPMARRLALPLLTAALFGAGGMAQAASTSKVTVNSIVITLTDLDPNDNITPWIAPMFMSQPYLNGGAGSFDPDLSRDAFAYLGKHDTSELTGSASTAFAWSKANIVGAANIVGFDSIVLNGSAASGVLGYGEYGAVGSSYTPMNFTISAHTAVSISFTTSIEVETTLGYDPQSGMDEHAAGHVLFSLNGRDDAGQEQVSEQYMEMVAGYQFSADGQPMGESQFWSGDLSVNFANNAGHDSIATFYGEAGLGGYSVSAVPEPAEYGMLLAGLGLIGSVARRRKQA